MPFFYRVCVEPVEILMVAVHEQCGKGLALQPVTQVLLLLIFSALVPDSAEVSANDYVVFLCHSFLLREYSGAESPEVLVAVSGDINHALSLPFGWPDVKPPEQPTSAPPFAALIHSNLLQSGYF